MIIDAHCHIWEPELMSAEMEKMLGAVAERFGPKPELVTDGGVDRLIRDMDEAGIDKTVLLALDVGIAFSSDLTVRDYNDYVAGLVEMHPDRLIGFAGIDPRRGK